MNRTMYYIKVSQYITGKWVEISAVNGVLLFVKCIYFLIYEILVYIQFEKLP